MKKILLVLAILLMTASMVFARAIAEPPAASTVSLIQKAEAYKANQFFTVQVSAAGNGSDVDTSRPWVTRDEMAAFDEAINYARLARGSTVDQDLEQAILVFNAAIKADGSDPYFRGDPGPGLQKILASTVAIVPETETTPTEPADNRFPSHADSATRIIANPFTAINWDNAGDYLIAVDITIDHTASANNGYSFSVPLANPVEVTASSAFFEFDLYYTIPAGSANNGNYMRMQLWSRGEQGTATTNAGGGSRAETYIRTLAPDLPLNPDWVEMYEGQSWYVRHISVGAGGSGTLTKLDIDIHAETGVSSVGTLMLGNIRITRDDPSGIPLPMVVNAQSFSTVAPVKAAYNVLGFGNVNFIVGTNSNPATLPLAARHYAAYVNGNNLKAEPIHPGRPAWLGAKYGDFEWAATESATTLGEFNFPTDFYKGIRDAATVANPYYLHGHVLAWYNQAPAWMGNIIPEHLEFGWNGTIGNNNFYANGNSSQQNQIKVNKEDARRIQFDHILYELRHFMTTDEKYGSSAERGIIPFTTFDVLNEEIHESRYGSIITANPNEWKSSLKHTAWLAAMMDDDYNDITQHYIYLLFKFAHIAVPNAQMAAKFQANYDSLPAYMKGDHHPDASSIAAYVTEQPPLLVYNDYGTSNYAKARTAYNMIKELNTAWKNDPLYDGRNLIEIMGMQGHDTLGRTLASDTQVAIGLFASLKDANLLDGITFSELDIVLGVTTPGGAARAPDVLNEKQSDALGYQYALLYKLFAKYQDYIHHIVSWSPFGSSWGNSYVLFDQDQNANAGYYGAMNPDKFILGHSYLDSYFEGEYDKIQPGYAPDIGL